MRHSIPEKGDMPNEQIPLSEEGKALAVSKRNIFSNVDRCFFFTLSESNGNG